jgi:Methyltransferase domain
VAGDGYADDVYSTYHEHLGGIDLTDARVLDVGAGGRYEIGVRFLEEGAEEVVCIDPFVAPPSTDPRIRVLSCGLGEAVEQLEPQSLDVIVSWVVLQEIDDLDAAFAAMDTLLRPGGRMVQKVDLLGYSALANRVMGGHPLGFLAVPDWLYARGRNRRRPNRARINAYREGLERRGFAVEVVVEQVLGRDVRGSAQRSLPSFDFDEKDLHALEKSRPWLRKRFRDLPAEDLLVTNAILIANKPAI